MNLDDVEAQPFADSPNEDGAVDQSIRADALGRLSVMLRSF